MSSVDFEKIYLNQSRTYGRMRIVDSGLGWKAAAVTTGGSVTNQQPFLLPSEEVGLTYWSRGARGWELRVHTKNQGVVMLDGFAQADFAALKSELQRNFDVALEHREHSLRGWNWGKTDLGKHELIFSVNNRPDFEIPYSEISNLNLTGKNEVAVELNLSDKRAGDELVEVRFYIPGTTEKGKGEANGEASIEATGEGEATNDELTEQPAANYFYEQLKDKADIGQVAGEAIVSFSDVLLLTPRGRYDIDMYPTSLRMRGKTYDYKIQYRQIEKIFLLPKPDDQNHLLVLQIDPPLRQGQTRYPFLVMQFANTEEIEVELNVDDAEFAATYADRLHKKYDQQTHMVISHCFKGLAEKPIVGVSDFTSKYQMAGVTCSLKASEGYLYPLASCFLFVTKPTVFIPYKEITNVTMSRVGAAGAGSKTFDLEVNLKGTGGSHVFSSIDREELESLQKFIEAKGVRVKNDDKEAQLRLNMALRETSDVDMDTESDDDDFKSGDDSDVAEEFDSDASVSDENMSGSDAEPSKKKAKN
ncbi:hypothetical protein BABINDRAFT_159555 [Babjeviella inositovora NRRL Y-12698]|uniref:FACT complex subunit POB3 n=1 Tax=Babjeviella inositovora NRRL Y-12698 TaxID=984486 RepID=A0A1E3QZM8_9ASCO|nr:uncharacterized protein BABINDRAFT_159555 [Babjeviella inositovora NRRL Y-12698]ODQ83098.1 hypothetical protein BABINDRAFT_159555 [Babjeviella inositovora NRRL Y-12698]